MIKYFATEVKDKKTNKVYWTFKKSKSISVIKFDDLNSLLKFFDNLKEDNIMIWIYQNGNYVRTIKKINDKIYDKYSGKETVVRETMFEKTDKKEECSSCKKEALNKMQIEKINKIKRYYFWLLIFTALILILLIVILSIIVFYNIV